MLFLGGLTLGFIGGAIVSYLYTAKLIAKAKAEAQAVANSVQQAAKKL